MSTAKMTYLLLDSSYDPVFDPTSTLVDRDAVAQAILTTLKLFFGEWWENLNLGLPVFQSMLGQLENDRTLNAMSLLVQQQIETVQYVTNIVDINAQFIDAQFNFTCTVQTLFGQVTVTNVPGAGASLG